MRVANGKAHQRWRGGLFVLGFGTALLVGGFTAWVVYAVGSVWLGGAR